MPLEPSDWLTIIGWIVTFALGGLATLGAQKFSQKRLRVGWSLVSESNLLSQATLHEIESGFRVPLEIKVRGTPVTDLSTIRVMVGNTGNTVVKNITLHFEFGDAVEVYVGRYIGDLGAYRRSLELQKDGSSARIDIAHINRGQAFEVEFLVGGYSSGELKLDLAAPGVSLRKMSNMRLERGLGRLQHFSLGFFGIKYNPTATQTAYLVEEVKALRRALERMARENALR